MVDRVRCIIYNSRARHLSPSSIDLTRESVMDIDFHRMRRLFVIGLSMQIISVAHSRLWETKESQNAAVTRAKDAHERQRYFSGSETFGSQIDKFHIRSFGASVGSNDRCP